MRALRIRESENSAKLHPRVVKSKKEYSRKKDQSKDWSFDLFYKSVLFQNFNGFVEKVFKPADEEPIIGIALSKSMSLFQTGFFVSTEMR